MFPKFLYFLFISLLVSLNLSSQSTCSQFSTYFGGTQFDEIKGVCIDANKNNYIIGNTYSTDLPITNGLINDTASGSYDVFLAKLDSCGNLVWCTYFGTPGFDSGEKIKMTNDGNLVFCGYTSGTSLPVSSGCFQASNNGSYDCFVTKITTNGTIIWNTYFGKSNGDFAYDITTDALDNIIIGGTTTSTNLYTTPSSFQPNHKGNTDAFIARFNKDGGFKWCTYYGGNSNEDIHALTTDNNCNVIGIGGTFSSNLNTSASAYQAFNDGAPDSYILKLDSNCTRVFSTYLGGSALEDAWGVVTDLFNNIYIGGHTNSFDFDTTSFAYQTVKKGALSDWYLSKLSPAGSLIASTLFGGTDNDLMSRMAFISPNKIMMLGKTESNDIPIFGTNNQPSLAGNYDSFLALFDTGTLFPLWSTYYGGNTDEDPFDITYRSGSNIVFVGNTNSTNYPLSISPYQPSLNTSTDGMITKLNANTFITTSINDIALYNTVEIFPNPCHNSLSIKSFGMYDVEIKNILGELVFIGKNNRSISMENLGCGVYTVTIKGKATVKTYKVIKQ